MNNYKRGSRSSGFRSLFILALFIGSLFYKPLLSKIFAISTNLATSSVTTASQPSTMRHLVKTSEGTLHTFVQMGTNTTKCGSGGLWWLYSIDSGVTWTCGGQVSSDTTNLMYADVRSDTSDNLYLVYSVASTGANAAYDVLYRKFTSADCSPAPCSWTMQSGQTVLDGDASGDNAGFQYATVELEGTTRAWIAVREFDGTNYQVGTYYSDSLGNSPTWTESVATLDTAGTNASYHYPTIVRYGSNIAVIWNDQVSGDLYWRHRNDSDGLTTWDAAAAIANRLTRFPTFSSVGDASGNIYLSVQDSTVAFYHYLSSWTSGATVASPSVSDQFTSLSTDGANVYVAYGDTTGIIGGVNRRLAYKKGVPPFATANFDSSPTPIASYHGSFDKFWLYDASADTYEDDTTDAGDIGTADVSHSSSSSVVKDVGDIAYLGKSTTFDALDWVLSTNGTGGGTLAWEYCSAVDGSSVCTTWSNLTFTASSQTNLKGSGYGSFTPPNDWVASKVNAEGVAYYYIRGRTTVAYTVGPVGTELTSNAFPSWVSLATTTSGVYGIWTENSSAPTKIRYSTILTFNSNPNAPTSLGGHVSGSYTSDTTPTLTFSLSDTDVGDTVKYRIQIDDTSDFSSVITDYTSALAAQGAASFTVGQAEGSGNYTVGQSSQTLSDGSYYWRVKTIDDDSVESSYSTANSGSIAFIIDSTAPSNPGTPTTSSSTMNTTPTWTWTASTDAGSGLANPAYTLEWSQSQTFASGVSSTTNNSNTYKHTTPLSDGTWYFRVKSSDAVGNETSYSSAGSHSIDDTSPSSFNLESPGADSYTNSERPTFKWKPSSDSIGLSKYVLEIDNPSLGSNQPSGDFTIDNISPSGTQSQETNKYVVMYENFSDSDSSNNYISVYTKSHNDWLTTENDGKLREGKVTWRVKAVDTSGNETSSTRTLFVDRNNPSIEISQINSIPHTTSSYSSTDPTPSIFGKITDTLSGGDSSQTQEKSGPRIASGPQKIEIKVEKSTTLGYDLISLYTINADKIYFTCDGKEVTSSTNQQCDKYLLFEYSPSPSLEKGTYKFTFSGSDKADNHSSQVTININISPSTQTTTTAEKQATTTTTSTTKKSTVTEPDDEFYVTKELEPTIIEKTQEKITEETTEIIEKSESFISKIFTGITESIEETSITTNAPGFIKTIIEGIGETASVTTSTITNVTSKVASTTVTLVQKTGTGIKNIVKNTRTGLANIAFALGDSTKGFAGNLSLAIIELAYKFVPEPTTISDVKVEVLSPTSAKISWETNQPANGKVNYGLDRTYTEDIQSEDRLTHHEFILTDLEPDTVYHFEVMSHSKNYVYDANREFKTPEE